MLLYQLVEQDLHIYLKIFNMITKTTQRALLIAVIYLVCFQLFLQSGFYSWLYAGNVIFCISIVRYEILKHASNPGLSLPALTRNGISLSFIASLFSLLGCFLLSIINYYLYPYPGNEYMNLVNGNASAFSAVKNVYGFLALAVTNSLFINLVCGSLAAFFAAGILNEKKYYSSSQPLRSV